MATKNRYETVLSNARGKPPAQGGKQVDWAPDIGNYMTDDEPPQTNSRTLTLYPRKEVAVGLHTIDADAGSNIRFRASATEIGENDFKISFNTWNDSKIHKGGASWLRVLADDPIFQVGYWTKDPCGAWANGNENTTNKKTYSDNIKFARPYDDPPNVIVWLSAFDSFKEQQWHIQAEATNITKEGFTINAHVWDDVRIWLFEVCWISHASNAAGITSGTFSRDATGPNTGTITFPKPFTGAGAPRLIMAINGFNFGNTKNLRAKVGGKWTNKVLKWSLDTWGDVKFRGLSAAYIAIERAIPPVSVLDTMNVPADKRPKSAAQLANAKKKADDDDGFGYRGLDDTGKHDPDEVSDGEDEDDDPPTWF